MSQELSSDQIQSVLQGISIPPQPQIMVDLQMEQMSPHCSIERITALISQDVGLSGSILKLVNSKLFGLSNQITSIKQAVNLMGVNSVINLVNALSIKGELSDDDIVNLGRFWDSAMEVAIAAAAIAKRIGFPGVDEAYTLGLFHNCGIPLLMTRFDHYFDIIKQTYANTTQPITDMENDLLRTNHAVVGYYVGRSWNLPEYLCRAIHEHHNVHTVFQESDNEPKKTTLLAILKMAENCCRNYQILGNQSEDHEWKNIEEQVLLYVGLSQLDFLNLHEEIHELGLGNGDYYA